MNDVTTSSDPTADPGPLPTDEPWVTTETQRYWDATAEGRIELPCCTACDLVIWYPRAICPDCHTSELVWRTMSGSGTVYSFTITRAGVGPKWRPHLPLLVAYVQLAEGPIVLTNLVDVDPDDVAIGMAVTAVFHDTGHGNAILRFTAAA